MLLLPSTVFGLPAHPLVVHVAVVLIPLSAMAFAAVGWHAALRHRFLPLVFVLALLGTGGAILAAQTGGPLEQSLRVAAQDAGNPRPRFGEHPEEGNRAEFFAIALTIAVGAVFTIDFLSTPAAETAETSPRLPFARLTAHRVPGWLPATSYVVALIPAVLAILTVVAAGHSGAQLVWKSVGG